MPATALTIGTTIVLYSDNPYSIIERAKRRGIFLTLHNITTCPITSQTRQDRAQIILFSLWLFGTKITPKIVKSIFTRLDRSEINVADIAEVLQQLG